EAAVLTILKDRGLELPKHYAEVSDSLDCITCTAWEVFSGKDDVKGRIKFMAKNYPLQLKEVLANINLIHETARAELDRLSALYEGEE
ncbi:hypothetical protein KAR91_40070, partial [Candidatus Pacearchaeota archaeon]|nr:hypothetical protein [Candidatus Pacearchaeota archaeon]